MDKRIILFLVLSMAVIVLYPYLLEKLGLAKRPAPAAPRAVAPKKDTAAPVTVTAPTPPSPQILPTPAPSARVPTPATEGREQEATVETDLVKVVLSNRGGVIKRLTFHQSSYLVDLTLETTGVSSSTTLSLGTNFGIHEWQEGFVGFIGPATFISGKLAKDTPEKEDLRAGQVTWAALQDKYFL